MSDKKTKKLSKVEREAYALVGRRGGQATFKKKGSKYMSAIGKKGAEKRWNKTKE